jgi:ribosomal protein S17E
MQQREQYQDFFSCTGFIVTIILAVLGFLGYNSLSSMEGRLKVQLGSSIKDKVRAVVESEVKNKFESYKEQTAEKINGDIQLFEEKFEHYKDSASNEIRSNIAGGMTDLYKNIEKRINQRIEEKYNPTLDEIGNLKSEINKLNRLVNELAKDNPVLTINSSEGTTDSTKVQKPPLVSHPTELVDENLLSYDPDPFNSNETKE